jgi:hypothetical protein
MAFILFVASFFGNSFTPGLEQIDKDCISLSEIWSNIASRVRDIGLPDLVQNGMTLAEVNTILGDDYIESGFATNSTVVRGRLFLSRGVAVSFRAGADGVYRVFHVGFIHRASPY